MKKVTELLKKVMVWVKAYRMALSLLALFGVLGGAGYMYEPPELVVPPELEPPKAVKVRPITHPNIEQICGQLITEHIIEYH